MPINWKNRAAALESLQKPGNGWHLRKATDYQDDKQVVLTAVKSAGAALEHASDRLRDDLEVVKAATDRKPAALQWAGPSCKDDKDLVLACIQRDLNSLQYASARLRGTKEIVLAAVTIHGFAIQHASEDLRADKEVALAAVQHSIDVLELIGKDLYADKDVMLAAAKVSGYALWYASEDLRADKELVLAAVSIKRSIRPRAMESYKEDAMEGDERRVTFFIRDAPLKYASSSMRADKEVVLAAVTIDGFAIQHASEDLRADKEVALAAVQHSIGVLELIGKDLYADKDVMLAAAKVSGYALWYASEDLRADKELVLAAVSTYHSIRPRAMRSDIYSPTEIDAPLNHASSSMRDDKDVVLEAVKTAPWSLKFADARWQEDKEMVLAAVTAHGYALKFASNALRADKDVVLCAVKRDNVLQYASEGMRGDHEVVLAAVSFRGSSLQYASAELRSDLTIAKAALTRGVAAFAFVAETLKGDPDSCVELLQVNGRALQFIEKPHSMEMVMAAVTNDGSSLKFAALDYRKNAEVVRKAMQENPKALTYAGAALRRDLAELKKKLLIEVAERDGFAGLDNLEEKTDTGSEASTSTNAEVPAAEVQEEVPAAASTATAEAAKAAEVAAAAASSDDDDDGVRQLKWLQREYGEAFGESLFRIANVRAAELKEQRDKYEEEVAAWKSRAEQIEADSELKAKHIEQLEKLKLDQTSSDGTLVRGRQRLATKIPPEGKFMSKSEFAKILKDMGLLVLQPGAPSEGQHVFHIIANSNGGPDHTHNYLYALGGKFNISIGDKLDHLNCYLAGNEASRRAFDISMRVAKDPRLHRYIEKRSGKRVLFTDRKHNADLTSGDAYYKKGYDLTRDVRASNRNNSNCIIS